MRLTWGEQDAELKGSREGYKGLQEVADRIAVSQRIALTSNNFFSLHFDTFLDLYVSLMEIP